MLTDQLMVSGMSCVAYVPYLSYLPIVPRLLVSEIMLRRHLVCGTRSNEAHMAAVAIRDVQERPVRVGCFGRAICVAHEACGNEILFKLHQQSRKAYIIR
jgi:hypothetical protein